VLNKIIKILIVASNPINTERLRLDEEIREITNGLNRSKYRDYFQVKQLMATRVKDLRRAMLDFNPNIVHFIGHGKGEEGIIFDNKYESSPSLVTSESLSELFGLFSDQIECVILNACYSEFQANVISEHINYVIGMKRNISDVAAIEFSVAFFDSMGAGESIEFSYKIACNAVKMMNIQDYMAPILLKKKTIEVKNISNLFYEKQSLNIDWENMPDLQFFVGRSKELEQLKKWIIYENKQVIAITGFGGIGKTNLSIRLCKGGIGKTELTLQAAKELKNRFDYVVCRSLLNAPYFSDTILSLIKFFSMQKVTKIPENVDDQISKLIYYIKRKKCLIILDNYEGLFSEEGKNYNHRYRKGYEYYGILLKKFGEISHQSCLLLTSRETPIEIMRMSGGRKPVKILELRGVSNDAGKKIIQQYGTFEASDNDWNRLISVYNGNPLALELSAKHIKEIFSGDIHAFLEEGEKIFSDIIELLSWHFSRLSTLEKEICYWLSINREFVKVSELKNDFLSPESKSKVTSSLQSIKRKLSLQESELGFSLQPVIIEYMTDQIIKFATDKLVGDVSKEILDEQADLINNFALYKALSNDYIRDSQRRLILEPIKNRICYKLGGQKNYERKIKKIIKKIQKEAPSKISYATGNLINLLYQNGTELNKMDFSNLYISQAYLQGATLENVNFSYCQFEKTVFTKTFSTILFLSFSPSGEIIATCDLNSQIHLWNISDGHHILTLSGHDNWVRCAAFSPDGKYIVSGGDDKTIKVWLVQNGECVKTLIGHFNMVLSVAFSSDGKKIFSASEDNTIRLWDIETGNFEIILNENISLIRSVCFSSDRKLSATGGYKNEIKIWNITDGSLLNTLSGHKEWGRALSFSPDCEKLASGSDDNTIRIWDCITGKCLQELSGHEDWIWSLAFNNDGKLLASGSEDNTLKIWDINKGNCINTFSEHKSMIRSVAISREELLASGGNDQAVRLWDLKNNKCISTLQGYTNIIYSIDISPDSKLIASGGNDQEIRLWDSSTGFCIEKFKGHTNFIRSIKFNYNGKLLASASNDQLIKIWDTNSRLCITTLKGHLNSIRSISFSPNGKTIASGSNDRTIMVWDIYSGKCLNIMEFHKKSVTSIDYDPQGISLVSGSEDHNIIIWDIEKSKPVRKLYGHDDIVLAVSFSCDGKYIASCSEDHTIKIWNVNEGVCLSTINCTENWPWTLTFDKKSKYLLSAGENGIITIWNFITGKPIHTLKNNTKNRLWSVALSSDGNMLISGGQDEQINIWDINTVSHLKTFRVNRPYEGTNITGVTGLSDAQKYSLKNLGAFDNS